MDENTQNTNTEPADQVDTISMSKVEYDKAIQSAEDKLRGKYSKQIKELEAKITELTPPVKSDAELEIEKRLAAIEQREREAEAKSKRLDTLAALSANKLDAGLLDYLKDDVDVAAFATAVEAMLAARGKEAGYIPTGHQNNKGITKEDWSKMDYAAKAKLYETNPTLAQSFMGGK